MEHRSYIKVIKSLRATPRKP
ncbi:hypothetical protein CY0110_17327 [Crocosphaera chwakensis CCY0110]|uniref:Uncharacterized protein n=1 Tax=Crocosphaera chwakensis CCY0110 TaxID=391612 RepID=A3IIE7_9CHRO|nr:hypothetical protein CY0110_17327 [Crocosphaera chwakensis CCY0110]